MYEMNVRLRQNDIVSSLRRFLDCLYVGTLAPQVDISVMGPMDLALLSAFESAFLNRLHLRFNYRDAINNATQIGDDVVFDFGSDGKLTVEGTTLSTL